MITGWPVSLQRQGNLIIHIRYCWWCAGSPGGWREDPPWPGPTRTDQDPPGPPRTTQDRPGLTRTDQDQPGPPRTDQDPPGPPRTDQDRPGPTRTDQDWPGPPCGGSMNVSFPSTLWHADQKNWTSNLPVTRCVKRTTAEPQPHKCLTVCSQIQIFLKRCRDIFRRLWRQNFAFWIPNMIFSGPEPGVFCAWS